MHNIRRDKSYFKLINPFDNFSTTEANRDSNPEIITTAYSINVFTAAHHNFVSRVKLIYSTLPEVRDFCLLQIVRPFPGRTQLPIY